MRNVLKQAGSPMLTVCLAGSLAAWYLALGCTGSVSWGWAAFDLTSFRLFTLLLFLNVGAAALEALLCRKVLRLCLASASLLVLVCGAYASLYRFEGTVGLAEGEAYEPIPPAFRSVNKGTLAPIPALAFTVTRINRENKVGRVEIVQHGVASEVGSTWQRTGNAEIRYEKAGVAPLIVVTSDEKGELERSYVKLEIDPPGSEDSFAFETLPYDFYLGKAKDASGSFTAYHLSMLRGKLSLLDRNVAVGEQVPVQSLKVSIQDERKFAMLSIRNRAGDFAFLASLVLLATVMVAALVVTVLHKRKDTVAG